MSNLDGTAVDRNEDVFSIRRETNEALVQVALDVGPHREPKLATGLNFFDHMLEMVGWWSDINVDASYEVKTFRLMHVVTEDTGLAFGAAVDAVLRARIPDGVESSGFAQVVMDEAKAECQLSFEGRSLAVIRREDAADLERVEDMLCVDLPAFFQGFCQGARATVHLDLTGGADPHHAWEAGFRSFGRALRSSLAPNPWRAGMTAGVKGTLD